LFGFCEKYFLLTLKDNHVSIIYLVWSPMFIPSRNHLRHEQGKIIRNVHVVWSKRTKAKALNIGILLSTIQALELWTGRNFEHCKQWSESYRVPWGHWMNISILPISGHQLLGAWYQSQPWNLLYQQYKVIVIWNSYWNISYKQDKINRMTVWAQNLRL
jgi:hypothetical protein